MPFNDTNIRWTDKVHNAVHGCSKSGSPGCANCYAERVSRQWGHTEHPWLPAYADANVQLKPDFLDDRLDDPAWVFANSMSDLYHLNVPDWFIHEYYDLCRDLPDSAFQILTKHGPDTARIIGHPPDNVMLGVSVGHPDWRYRIDWLRNQPVATRFVSFEPLVACIPEVDLSGIDWAIIGGESGPESRRRDMDPAWARNLVRACRRQDVKLFFKQHSGARPESDVELDMGDGRGPRRFEEFPQLPHGVVPAPREFLEGEVVA